MMDDPAHLSLPPRHLVHSINGNHADRRSGRVTLLPLPRGTEPGLVINKIQDIFHQIQVDLLHERDLTIVFRTRPRARQAAPLNDDALAAPRLSTVRFPGGGAQEAKRFARLLKLLHLIHESLTAGTVLTKRNIYYQDVDLFGTQAVVDQMVDDLAFTLDLGRADLNVVAAGKGLASGSVVFTLREAPGNAVIPTANGLLIPPVRDIGSIDVGAANWILVVEKEATFRSLSVSGYCNACTSGPGVLITGKGYPDLNTRAFLHTLNSTRPELPIFAVVDFDPDGLGILRCYKDGSMSLGHEAGLQVPDISWLGVKIGDVLPSSGIEVGEEARLAGPSRVPTVRPLTLRDRRTAKRVLGGIGEDDEDQEVRRELQVMLFLGIKAEIQGVDNAGDLAEWLDEGIEKALSQLV